MSIPEPSRTRSSRRGARGALAGALGLALALALAGAGAVSAGASTGSFGLRLLDAPLTAGIDPRAQIYIVDHLAPGTVIHRRIELSNTTSSTAHVATYPAAATLGNGTFLGAAGHTPNELSTWTAVRPGISDVPAGKRLRTVVTIAVPRDAAPGERYGVIWAEVRGSGATGGGGITEVNRVGIRIYLSVGPGGPPAANFKINGLTAARSRDGRPTVIATVHNTGGRALDMSGTLRLVAGPGGLNAGPFPANLGTTLAIGDTEPVAIVLDKRLPAGPWTARVALRSGLVERSKQATITFPGAHAASRLPSLITAGVIGLLVLLGMTALLVRARKAGTRPAWRAGAPSP